jgi:hypothetical protein
LDEDDDERRIFLADSLLEIDPGNPVAKYIKWQSMEDEESIRDMSLLEDAIASMRPTIDILDEEDDDDAAARALYVSMLSDLASFLYVTGEHDRAFVSASEFMKLDRDCNIIGRLVYYAVQIERGEFASVIETADSDICETPAGEFCRALAAFELEGCSAATAECLLGAFSMDPDLAYYILGLWTIDDEDIENEDDEDGYIEETMMTVAVLSELWAVSEERLAFLSIVAFAFGYLTGRMEGPEDMTMIEDSYREVGCLEDIRESRDILHAMLAEGREQEEVDEEALSLFRKMEYFGLFG